eukprot:jgi/Mesen1/5396/ME000268S04592
MEDNTDHSGGLLQKFGLENLADVSNWSSATFFTAGCILVALYFLLKTFKKKPKLAPPPSSAPPEPVQLGDISAEELLKYDGRDPKEPLLIAIRGVIYDVSRSRGFYGPGGPYEAFAGRDASRALGKMSTSAEDVGPDTSGLSAAELDTLNDWEFKFISKYPTVGKVASAVAAAAAGEGAAAADTPAPVEGLAAE